MDLRILTTPLGTHRDEAAVLLLSKQDDAKRLVSAVGRTFARAFEALWDRKAFEPAAGNLRVLQQGSRQAIPTLVVVGYGPVDGSMLEGMRRAASEGARAARAAGARSVTLVVPRATKGATRTRARAEAVTEGAVMGLYRFETHKGKKDEQVVTRLTVLAKRGEQAQAKRGAEAGRIVADGVALARDLGNEPGNRATPTYLAETAERIAKTDGLTCRVLEESEMKALGMGGLLGVSQGSQQPAKLILLTYEPPRRKRRPPTVAIVGKGLTFDSGGISIKPGAKMEDMKFDMCGGAAVLGTMQTVARLKVPVRVVGLVPASENLPGGNAYKPGDILRAMNGVTIEIRNTDAEGRLILADALAYASSKLRPRPKAIIDMATLTGACVVALGAECAGLVGTNDPLVERIEEAGADSGDAVWRLPFKQGYQKQMESPYADVSNLGTPGAGALTAAAFLEKFTGGLPWAHLDIAGVAWTDKTTGYLSRGATGFAVRLMSRLLRDWKS